MIEQLFGSKTRVKLLQLFYSNPNRSFYVREITRKIDEQINSVRRELANLLSIGIITSDTTNNRLYYEVNQDYEYFDPLKLIFGNGLSTETKDKLNKGTAEQETLKSLGAVDLAIFTGQLTRDDSAAVDVLVIGNVNQNKLIKFISELETKEGKELRYAVMTSSEFDYRRQIKDRFVTKVLTAKKQVLIDKHDRLAGLVD